MVRVRAPVRIEYPSPKAFPKNTIPNKPNIMDGIPDRVSVVNSISRTTFPGFAYSFRYTADPCPGRGDEQGNDYNVQCVYNISQDSKGSLCGAGGSTQKCPCHMRDSAHEHIPHDACQKKDGEAGTGIYDDCKEYIQAAYPLAVYAVLYDGVL